MVSAVIKIGQYDSGSTKGGLRLLAPSATSSSKVRNLQAGATSSTRPHHLPAVSNPQPRPSLGGWQTEDEEDWSDSPTAQPLLLYRYRFGWGRDNREIFAQPDKNLTALALGSDGFRWGNLDTNSGQIVYEEEFARSDYSSIKEFSVKNYGFVRQAVYNVSSSSRISHLGEVSSFTTLSEFPFLLVALPEPFSEKNPVDSDVFIRLSNYASTISSGTITLFLDDVEQPDLNIAEFFGGLGGYDVTWANTFNFDYDASVQVRWEFRDSDIPSNKFVIEYPFYTVLDLAGPRVSNISPGDLAVEVAINSSIQFDLEDFENDVDIDTLRLYVNNTLAEDGVTGDFLFTRFENKKGYTVRYTPYRSFLYGDLIPVVIFVDDTSVNDNEIFYSYSFTTVESFAPRLLNLEPSPCTIQVPTGADIVVDVIDGGHGLDKDTIVFTVDEIEQGNSILLIPIIHRDV